MTQFQYNTKGELTQITDPLNHVTTLTYTPAGLIASIKDAQNNVTSPLALIATSCRKHSRLPDLYN